MNYRTVQACSLLILAVIDLSCNRTPKPESAVVAPEQPLVIRTTQSPTDGDSREPDLYATYDGRVMLSWVEKVTEKRYALRSATLDGNGWGEARTVSQGENWFVNWADFPSVIALKNGTLALVYRSQVLRKGLGPFLSGRAQFHFMTDKCHKVKLAYYRNQ